MFMRESLAFCCQLAAWQFLSLLIAHHGESVMAELELLQILCGMTVAALSFTLIPVLADKILPLMPRSPSTKTGTAYYMRRILISGWAKDSQRKPLTLDEVKRTGIRRWSPLGTIFGFLNGHGLQSGASYPSPSTMAVETAQLSRTLSRTLSRNNSADCDVRESSAGI